MKSRMYWGLGALVLLIIGVTVFSVLKDRAEIRRLQNELDTAMHGHTHADGDPAHSDGTDSNASQAVRPSEKVSLSHVLKTIRETDVTKETPKPKPKPKKVYTGPLTFHEELLKTNPVKALRLQQEERGHWSAEWIPPFTTDDTEAQEFARAEYLRHYYWLTYDNKLDTPEYEKETKAFHKARAIANGMFSKIRSYPYGARKMDLMKLTWHALDSDPVTGGIRHPSEYFGDPERRAFLKEHGAWDY